MTTPQPPKPTPQPDPDAARPGLDGNASDTGDQTGHTRPQPPEAPNPGAPRTPAHPDASGAYERGRD